MKVKVDKDLCAGCGVCAEVCPEVFEMDENDIAVVKLDPVPPEHHEACRVAVRCDDRSRDSTEWPPKRTTPRL